MTPGGTPDCLNRFTLEKLLAGALSADSADARHAASCAHCGEALRALRAEGDAYMLSDDARALRQKLAEASEARAPKPLLPWLRWAVPLAVAATVSAVVVWRTRGPDDDWAPRGAPSVRLLVQRAETLSPWTQGPLQRGDVLQLEWVGARAAYVAVIGREEGGETQAWFPTGGAAEPLAAGTRAIGDSLRFDPPFAGTVFVLTAAQPFPLEPALEAVRAGRAPALDGQVTVLKVPKGP
jgi:hypothetical protein